MDFSLRYLSDANIFIVLWNGQITTRAWLEFLEEYSKSPHFSRRAGTLHDVREAKFDMVLEDIYSLQSSYDKLIRTVAPAFKICVLVKTSVQFASARQFNTVLSLDEGLLITYSETDAKAHVGLPDSHMIQLIASAT